MDWPRPSSSSSSERTTHLECSPDGLLALAGPLILQLVSGLGLRVLLGATIAGQLEFPSLVLTVRYIAATVPLNPMLFPWRPSAHCGKAGHSISCCDFEGCAQGLRSTSEVDGQKIPCRC